MLEGGDRACLHALTSTHFYVYIRVHAHATGNILLHMSIGWADNDLH
jgi:hypothetical protein